MCHPFGVTYRQKRADNQKYFDYIRDQHFIDTLVHGFLPEKLLRLLPGLLHNHPDFI